MSGPNMSDPREKDLRHERRKFLRADIYAVTHYLCPIRKHEVKIQARLSNISEGGAMILTFEEGIPVGTEISISFVLPGDKEELLTVKAKVRHTGLLEESISPSQSLFRSGVEFIMLNPRQERMIRDYVSSKLNQETVKSKPV